MENTIRIRGAREHNLKNINLEIPRDKLVVITGLSGSGKSSLAFDTIYAEGQRRYVESLSAYARQFLGQMDKPDVDYIEGLSPAISIDQKTTSRNPRSTVGTVTEIYDYLRLLFARAGRPHCPKCGKPIAQQTVDQMLDRILALPERTKFLVMAQVVRSKKGQHRQILDHIRREGYGRVRIDGVVRDLGEEIELEKNKKHTIEVVVDRLTVHEGPLGLRVMQTSGEARHIVRHIGVDGPREHPGSGGGAGTTVDRRTDAKSKGLALTDAFTSGKLGLYPCRTFPYQQRKYRCHSYCRLGA